MTHKPEMPARTLEALKASIEKWRKNENGDFQGVYSNTCPLCKLFAFGENIDVCFDDSCKGCPVATKTGEPDCLGSPYIEAYSFFDKQGSGSEQFKSAAKAERIFLESLLPKEARK